MKTVFGAAIAFLASGLLFGLDSTVQADDQQKLEDVMTAGVPGPVHKQLAKLAGEYTIAANFRTANDPKSISGTGKATLAMNFDGRFLVEDSVGEMGGKPFKSMHVLGYNKISKRYEAVWLDSPTTVMMWLQGTSNDNGKNINFVAGFKDPKWQQPFKIVMAILNDDHFKITFDTYDLAGHQETSSIMEYTRKK
jgi:hypothetical protein